MSEDEWVYGVTNTGQRRHVVRKHHRGYWYTVCHAETVADARGVDMTLPVCKKCELADAFDEILRSTIKRGSQDGAPDGDGG